MYTHKHILTGMLSKPPNQSSYLYGSYRSYSQGSEKDKEREIAILMYYENGELVMMR
jgi:hypothetical protein